MKNSPFIVGAPSFPYLQVDLEAGESLRVGSQSLVAADHGLRRRGWGGAFYVNRAESTRRITLRRSGPGDVVAFVIAAGGLWLRKDALFAATSDVQLTRSWKGVAPWVRASGPGCVWLSACGGVVTEVLDAPMLVRRTRLLAFEEGVKLCRGFGVEARLEGGGRYLLQTRGLEMLRRNTVQSL